MTQYIILIPALIATLYCLLRSSAKALVSVYIPTLLILPQYFHLNISGFPDLSFAEWVICVIALSSFFKLLFGYRYTALDFIVILFCSLCVYSETINNGPKEGLALAGIMVPNTLLPYILGKALIHPSHLSASATKKIVFVMFLASIIAVYELRFTINPYLQLLEPRFPDQLPEVPVLYRYGFVRVSGPMIQPILFGSILSISILLNVWMIRSQLWEKTFKFFPFLPTQLWIFRKEGIIQVVLVLGLIFTFSRGPWGATLLGFILLSVGYSKHKLKSLSYRMFILMIIGFIGVESYIKSLDITLTLASTEENATALYRGILLKKYWSTAMNQIMWGYGSQSWPKVIGMKSVDNQYLYLWLKHGLPAVFVFISLFIWIIVRLVIRGIKNTKENYLDTTFSFTLAGSIFSFFITFFIVFMGSQTGHLFFLMLGWAEGFLLSDPKTFTKDILIKKKFPQLQTQVYP